MNDGTACGASVRVDALAETFAVSVVEDAGQLALSWPPVEGCRGYRVWCGLSPSSLELVSDLVSDQGYVIGGLRSGMRYFIQVTAVFPFLSSEASVDADTGERASQEIAYAPSPSVNTLSWNGMNTSDTVVSQNGVLVTLGVSEHSEQLSSAIVDGVAMGYVEVQVMGPNADVFGSSTFCGLVDGAVSGGAKCGFVWKMGDSAINVLCFHSDNDGLDQLIAYYYTYDYAPVIGMVVDSVGLQAWFSYDGQFWDSASRQFKDTYLDCIPCSLGPGSRAVVVSHDYGVPT